MNPDYVRTVELLLNVAPTVFRSGLFAMKGGGDDCLALGL